MTWYHSIRKIRRVHANADASGRPKIHIRGSGGSEPHNVVLEFQNREHMESFIEAMEKFDQDTIVEFGDVETDGGG